MVRPIAAIVGFLALMFGVSPAPAQADHLCAPHDPFDAELIAELSDRYAGQRFSAEVYDTRTGCTFTLYPTLRITTASVLKIEVMAGVLLRAQQEGRTLTSWEADRIGPMMRESSDPETSALWLSLGGAVGMESLDVQFGLVDTIHVSPAWGATLTSAHDQVTMVRQTLSDSTGPLNAVSQEIARGYMTSVTPSQRWGISAGVPNEWAVAIKNGFFPLSGVGWRINSAGFVEDPSGGGYAVAILTDGWDTESAGIEANELVALAISESLAIEDLTLDGNGTFWDDDHSTFEVDIETIAGLGISTGCNPPFNDKYCPGDLVTRGQMAAFIRRFLNLEASDQDRFADDEGSVFESDIDAIAAAGITRGCNPPQNDRFCPDATVTRGEMAALLARALHLEPGPPHRFVDDDESVFQADIEAVAFVGITLGCNPPSNDQYCPEFPVTRGQMAAFLARSMPLVPLE